MCLPVKPTYDHYIFLREREEGRGGPWSYKNSCDVFFFSFLSMQGFAKRIVKRIRLPKWFWFSCPRQQLPDKKYHVISNVSLWGQHFLHLRCLKPLSHCSLQAVCGIFQSMLRCHLCQMEVSILALVYTEWFPSSWTVFHLHRHWQDWWHINKGCSLQAVTCLRSLHWAEVQVHASNAMTSPSFSSRLCHLIIEKANCSFQMIWRENLTIQVLDLFYSIVLVRFR